MRVMAALVAAAREARAQPPGASRPAGWPADPAQHRAPRGPVAAQEAAPRGPAQPASGQPPRQRQQVPRRARRAGGRRATPPAGPGQRTPSTGTPPAGAPPAPPPPPARSGRPAPPRSPPPPSPRSSRRVRAAARPARRRAAPRPAPAGCPSPARAGSAVSPPVRRRPAARRRRAHGWPGAADHDQPVVARSPPSPGPPAPTAPPRSPGPPRPPATARATAAEFPASSDTAVSGRCGAQRDQPPRQQILRDRHARRHPQPRVAPPPQRLRPRVERLRRLHDPPRPVRHQRPGVREPGAARRAVDQRHAQLPFHRADPAARGGLGDADAPAPPAPRLPSRATASSSSSAPEIRHPVRQRPRTAVPC